MIADGLIIPTLLLGVMAFAVPRVIARLLPEGVAPLLVNGFVSTAVMFVLSAAFFFCLYVWQGANAAQLAGQGIIANAVFFGRLGLAAGLIWAPILILSLAGLPRRWVHATW